MRESDAIIERVWRISSELQRLEVTVEAGLSSIQPGQSVLVLEGTAREYLREQWIPVSEGDGQLVFERPVDNHYSPGQVLSLLGPVGSPLPWIGGGGKHLLLVAHDMTPVPLLLLAQQAVAQTSEVALILLGNSADYPYEGIPPAVEVISGSPDGTWIDEDQIIRWADQIFAVVNPAFSNDYFGGLFHRIREEKTHVPVNFVFGVFTLPVPCGTGACMACMVRCKTTNKLTCIEGPALDLNEVLLT